MDKIKSFLKYLEENNIKRAVLLNRENINYFLERYPPAYSLLTFEVETNRVILNVPKLEYKASQTYRDKNIEISIMEKIEDLIKEGDAFEDTLPLKYVKYLPKGYKIISPKIMEMRSIKTDKEIEFIKMASKISKKSLEHGIDYLLNSEGEVKEIELAAEIEYSMKKKGSIKPAFDTIVISNKKTALPHGIPSKDIIKNIVLIDIGAVYEGYCSDTTRTILLKEDNKYREIY